MERIDQAEKERRILSVKEWLLVGYDTSSIVGQGKLLWKVGERQVYRYIEDAYDQFEKELKKTYLQTKAKHIESRKRLVRNLKGQESPKGARAALSIWDSIARIEGVLKDHIEHEVKITKIKVTRKDKQSETR